MTLTVIAQLDAQPWNVFQTFQNVQAELPALLATTSVYPITAVCYQPLNADLLLSLARQLRSLAVETLQLSARTESALIPSVAAQQLIQAEDSSKIVLVSFKSLTVAALLLLRDVLVVSAL